MEDRSIIRFSLGAITVHWIHTIAFAILIITGALMFFHLTDFSGGLEIRIIHRIVASFFIAIPLIFAFLKPRSAISFLGEAFLWNNDDVLWLKTAIRYYFGGRRQMPPQGRINGDQKLWQLIVSMTGLVFILTGIILWFFKLKISMIAYQWVLLMHAAAFILIAVAFLVHLYLRMFYPDYNESLSSMLDGRVSGSYAREHYSKWYTQKIGGNKSSRKI